MPKSVNRKISPVGSFVIGAGETRPGKVVGRISGKTTLPTTKDRQAARALVRLKKA
jgi:hypothetical protein